MSNSDNRWTKCWKSIFMEEICALWVCGHARPFDQLTRQAHLRPSCILKFQPPSSLDYRACHGPQLIANARNSSISRISHQKSLIQNDNFSFIFCGTIRLYPDSGRAAVQAFFMEKFRFVYTFLNLDVQVQYLLGSELSTGNHFDEVLSLELKLEVFRVLAIG